MNLWLFFAVFVLLFLYLFFSLYLAYYISSNFQDYYNDEDVTYSEGRPDWVPKDGFLFDMHCHTRASDGLLTPRQLILYHISNGYDGLVLTDHNTMQAVEETVKVAKEIDPNFIVIPGVEFTSLRIHLNLIGITNLMKIPNLIWPRKKTVIDAINHAHSENGLVQFNHRDWYPHKKYLPKEWYLENDIDGFESFNGFGFIDDEVDDFIKKNRDKKILFASGGTDVHDPAKHLRVYTEILTKNRSIEGIMDALRKGKTKVYLNKEAEKKRNRPEKGKIKENPDKKNFIKKWIWLYWPSYAIFFGNNKLKLILLIFIMSILIFSLVFSFI